MALADRLIAQIRANGPLTVAQFMTACLHDPQDGYYATRPALGEDGDFITAPLVSQMFGELIGLWLVQAWIDLGRPAPFRLVEMGPGDGTLMSDILRAARVAPDVLPAADIWLVEVSEPLRAQQAERLAGQPIHWAGSLAEVPAGAPLLLVANELLDCLAPLQFVRTARSWAERLVSVDDQGRLAWGLGGGAALPLPEGAPEPAPGQVLELCAGQQALGAELGARMAADGGAALLIDYGRAAPGYGDTLQALSRHQKVDVLATAGQADLTVHADFPAVVAAARVAGAAAAPILTQGEFLMRLGIVPRAEALAAARPERADQIERQLLRLIAPDQMGELFKVACLCQSGLTPPAFETAA